MCDLQILLSEQIGILWNIIKIHIKRYKKYIMILIFLYVSMKVFGLVSSLTKSHLVPHSDPGFLQSCPFYSSSDWSSRTFSKKRGRGP